MNDPLTPEAFSSAEAIQNDRRRLVFGKSNTANERNVDVEENLSMAENSTIAETATGISGDASGEAIGYLNTTTADVLAPKEEVEEIMSEWEEATAEHDTEWFAKYDATHKVSGAASIEFYGGEEEDQWNTSSASSLTGMMKNEYDNELAKIQQGLQLDEKEAEAEDAAENAKLDELGYENGTEPIGDDDDYEQRIETNTTMDDVVYYNVGTNETAQELDIEQALEEWKAVEEWKEATEEHDKEFFDEWEKEHSVKPNDETEATDDENPTGTGGDDDDTADVADDDDIAVTDDDDTPVTGDDDNIVVPSPVAQPTSRPPTTGGGGWNPPVSSPTFHPLEPAATVDCTGLVGQLQCGYEGHPLATYAMIAFVPLLLICCMRKYCRPKSALDTRGQYRAVAAQYGNMGYDNTFSDTFSDDEDDDFVNGNGDIEDDSWGKSGKRTLELPSLRKEQNGGLTLAEMNG